MKQRAYLDHHKSGTRLVSSGKVNIGLPARDIESGQAISACATNSGSDSKKGGELHSEGKMSDKKQIRTKKE